MRHSKTKFTPPLPKKGIALGDFMGSGALLRDDMTSGFKCGKRFCFLTAGEDFTSGFLFAYAQSTPWQIASNKKINIGEIIMNIQTFEDVNKALFEIAQKDSFITKKEVAMNEKINKIKTEFDQETKTIRAEKQLLEQEIEGYCKANKLEFGKQKSKSLLFGTVFFRTTPPKVSQLNRKYTVATTIELAIKLFKNKFVREKKELDKDAILASYAAKEIDDEKLAAIGLKIDQEEKFGYDINWEKLKEE